MGIGPITTDKYIGVTSNFIKAFSKNLIASVVYMDTCHSLENSSMANAFIDNGAKTYFGWSGVVDSRYSKDYPTKLINYLYEQYSVKNAYNELSKDFTNKTKAKLNMYEGDGSHPLPIFGNIPTISGRVTYNGTGMAGVSIAGRAITDSNGNYSYTAPWDNYTFNVQASKDGYDFTPTWHKVNVNGADVTDVNFTATASTTPKYTISGQVTGAVVSGVTITLSGTGSSSVTTDTSGNYSFINAANGNYTITPSRSGYSFSPSYRSITVNGANLTGQNFTATANTSNVNLFFLPRGSIDNFSDSVVISTHTGDFIDATTITENDEVYVDFIYFNNGSQTITKDYVARLYVDNVLKFTSTGENPLTPIAQGNAGGYADVALGKLSAGTHTFKVVLDADNQIAESNESDNEYTKTITVAASGYTMIGSIFGHVTISDTGKPLPGATIRLDIPNSYTQVTTDSNGYYSLPIPSLGDYFLISVGKDGYIPQTANISKNNLLASGNLIQDFALKAAQDNVLILEIVPEVHHLGDDNFSGGFNSQFQQVSEGLEYTDTFMINANQLPPYYNTAELHVTIKGSEGYDPVYINNVEIGSFYGSPSDGSFGKIIIPLNNISILKTGLNTLRINSVEVNTYDDFEYANVLIYLYK